MNNNITSEEFFKAFASYRTSFIKAVTDTLYKRGKRFRKEDIEDIVSEALLQFVLRLETGKIVIPTVEKGYAYMMRSCLWNGRDESDRDIKRSIAHHKAHKESSCLDSVEWNDFEVEEEKTEQDRQDERFSQMHTELMLYLEQLIIDGVFTFKAVNMFKCYFLNGFSFNQLAEVTGYSKSTCFKLVDDVRKHIRENKGT